LSATPRYEARVVDREDGRAVANALAFRHSSGAQATGIPFHDEPPAIFER